MGEAGAAAATEAYVSDVEFNAIDHASRKRRHVVIHLEYVRLAQNNSF